MKLKSLIVTVAVLAALSLAVFLARRPAPPPSADARIGQPLVDAAIVEQAVRLEISDAGRTVTLARQSNGTWRVPVYHDLPADFQKLTDFIRNLTDAKLQRLVSTNPDRISRLEFNDSRISLLDSAEKPLWTITLGKTPETGGGRFVRYGDEQKAYLANLSVWLDAEPKNWAHAEILNVKPEDVARVEIPFAGDGGPIGVSRAKPTDQWTADKAPQGQQVKADKITSVLNTVGNLRFSDTSDPADANAVAARENLRSITLTTFDGKTIAVALGRKPGEKKLKPPAPAADGTTGPAALGSVADLAQKQGGGETADAKQEEQKPLEPEFETIPAGPVYAFVTHSDASAPVNELMQKRAKLAAQVLALGV
ncbi:MAG: DUF4340 domain-containing protein, partial [Opitutus sp.]